MSQLEGKDVNEVIADGMGKLGSLSAAMPAGMYKYAQQTLGVNPASEKREGHPPGFRY